MSLIRWKNEAFNPFDEFNKLQDDINKLFNGAKGFEGQGLFDRTVSPAIDVSEDKDNFTLVCDLPGVQLEDLDISVTQDILTIKGEKKGRKKTENTNVFKQETWEGNFQRTLALPSSVDPSKVEATLIDGVLTVTLPKREEVKPKQISIKTK